MASWMPRAFRASSLASVVGASCMTTVSVISRRRAPGSRRGSRSTAGISSTRPARWSWRAGAVREFPADREPFAGGGELPVARLAAGLVEHPAPERYDEPGLLGEA